MRTLISRHPAPASGRPERGESEPGREPAASYGGSVRIGGLWLFMTVVFEFGFGDYVVGASRSTLLADYGLIRGNLRILVLLTIGIATALVGRSTAA